MDVPGTELLEAATGRRELFGLRRVVSLRVVWEAVDDHDAPVMDSWMADESTPEHRVHLRLGGVFNLRLESVGGNETCVSGLAIDDVQDRQLERAAWELYDYEDDSIRCFAASAEIVEVVRVG